MNSCRQFLFLFEDLIGKHRGVDQISRIDIQSICNIEKHF